MTQQSAPPLLHLKPNFEHKITDLELEFPNDVIDQKHKINTSEKVYPKFINSESFDLESAISYQKEPEMQFDSIIVKQLSKSDSYLESIETVIANRHTFVLDDHKPKADVADPVKNEVPIQVGVQSTGSLLHEISSVERLPSRVLMKNICMDVEHPMNLSSLHKPAYTPIKVCASQTYPLYVKTVLYEKSKMFSLYA